MGLTPHPPRCWLPGMGRTVISAAAVALSLALPAAAWPCNEPSGQRDGGQPAGGTGSGERVYFVISGVDEGATWTLSWEGASKPIEGTVEGTRGSDYHGSFPMPDLGNQNRTVHFSGEVVHEAHADGRGPWPLSVSVQFRGGPPASPSPSPPPVEQPSAPQHRPAPIEQPSTRRTRPAPVDVKAPTNAQPLGGGGSFPAGGTGGWPPSGPAGPGGGPGTPSSPFDPSGGPVGSAIADSGFAAEGSSAGRSGRVPEPVRTPLSERAADGAGVPAVPLAAPPAREDADGPGRIVLVLVALTAAGVAAALAVRRRRGGSGRAALSDVPLVPSDPAVEAELQEIIAEERAKLDEVRDERSPGEMAAARDDPG
jgi:hypothetical protein